MTESNMTDVSEQLARDLCRYVMANDVLTMHGMKGLRERIKKALEGADALHSLALARVDKLMDAAAGSPEADELSALADAVVAYEKCLWPPAGIVTGPTEADVRGRITNGQ